MYNYNYKRTREQRAKIFLDCAKGVALEEVSLKYGISVAKVKSVVDNMPYSLTDANAGIKLIKWVIQWSITDCDVDTPEGFYYTELGPNRVLKANDDHTYIVRVR